MSDMADQDGATVVPCEDGPLLLRGNFTLRTPQGDLIDPGRATVALCRCGKSAIKPFCDGTHKAIGFRAASTRETPAPRETTPTPGTPAAPEVASTRETT
jgi:CDGSH-type Zn-finger protein